MITPSQLKEHEFKPAGRNAYKAEDVDAFFAELRADYEKMFRENSEITKRANSLAEALEQYRKKDDELKKVFLAAQRASEVIKQEAEASAKEIRAEADAALAAAKSEAQIIKDDAAKKAESDSELLLSVTREKVQDIIVKAKKEADDIISQARDNAGDQIGVATRTVTKETIHYDMLKKEVTEFKNNILGQYKTHIELIQKLPEIALAEALRLNGEDPDAQDAAKTEQNYEDEAAEKADEIIGSIIPEKEPVDEAVVFIDADEEPAADDAAADDAAADDAAADDAAADNTDTDDDGNIGFDSGIVNAADENAGLEVTFVDGDGSEFTASDTAFDTLEVSFENAADNGENVEFTQLPYSFVGDSAVEYFNDTDSVVDTADYSGVDSETYSFDSEADFVAVTAENTSDDESVSHTVETDTFKFEKFDVEASSEDDLSEDDLSEDVTVQEPVSGEPEDIPISRPASFNKEEVEKISESVSAPEEKPAEHRKKAFFKRKKNSNNN